MPGCPLVGLLWLPLLLVILTAQPLLTQACPQRCNCLELQVLCQEAGYQELPAPVPRAAVALLLTSNQLERLGTDSFRGLVRLRKLILDNNRIQSVAPFAFRGLAGLDELSLQNNPLTVLSKQALSGLSRVRMLQLGFNRIGRIEAFAFAGSSDIGSISLEGNPLELLRSRAFANLSRVGSLRLPRGLAAMEPDSFAGLKNVSLVSLEAPRLERLPQFAFRGLEHAGELLIRDAEIGLIDSGAFAGLSHARRVTLEGCSVSVVRAAAFAGMRAVGQLRLGANRLGSVLPGALDALDQASVGHVLLAGNWMPCDCRLQWTPEPLRRRGFCSAPVHLLNASAAQVSLDTLPRCLPEHFVPHSRPSEAPMSGRTSAATTLHLRSPRSIIVGVLPASSLPAALLAVLALSAGSPLYRCVVVTCLLMMSRL
ncbi:uncharacterized protein LOC144174658 [Haemaphysalis longicornis]